MVALCALLEKAAINRERVGGCQQQEHSPRCLGLSSSGHDARTSATLSLSLSMILQPRSHARRVYIRMCESSSRGLARPITTRQAVCHGAILRVHLRRLRRLLSDVDVVWLQNPFTLPSLYRDVDVEGMTDGWDDPTVVRL